MATRPNVLFLFADQVRACALPAYGEEQLETPNLDRLCREGALGTNALSTCPICTPYRAMMLTGRYPQSTGIVVNGTGLRHDETTLADVFGGAGYRTAWIGKWHLHPGSYPLLDERDPVPSGSDRGGFHHWRGYNFHLNYDDPWLDSTDGRSTYRALGYEPHVLAEEAMRFMDDCANEPFLCCLSSHLGHFTHLRFAPDRYYDGLPERPELPNPITAGNPNDHKGYYRHYLAMVRALDEMVGTLLRYLDERGLADNTLVVFTSDHGTESGAHGDPSFWHKMHPYDTTVRIPWLMRCPGRIPPAHICDTLIAPTDLMPSLCGFCDVPIPPTCEGHDVSPQWMGAGGGPDAALLMNFVGHVNHACDGKEWRAVRTRTHTYVRHIDGAEELYDLTVDPWQQTNLAASCPESLDLLRNQLDTELAERSDAFLSGHEYARWIDPDRRPFPLSRRLGLRGAHPEGEHA